MKIIAIDDSQINLDFFQDVLGREFEVEEHLNSAEAMLSIRIEMPDIVLLDCIMPEKNGLEVLAEIKNEFPNLPVIMVSGFKIEDNLIEAMNMQVDDFIFKPVFAEELIARIKCKIDRSRKFTKVIDECDELENVYFNDLEESVTIDDVNYNFKGREYSLLKFLIKRKNQLVSKDDIFKNVWERTYVSKATLDTHVCQIRKKLNNHSSRIITRKNAGFIFSTESERSL